jgi:hypothetical protein
MLEMVADPLLPSCYHALLRPGIQEIQQLGPAPFLPRAQPPLLMRIFPAISLPACLAGKILSLIAAPGKS